MISHNGITITPKLRLFRHAGRHYRCSQYERYALMLTLICAGPRTKDELFDAVYGHREDGGPDGGVEQIAVYLSQIRAVAHYLKLQIIVARNGRIHSQYMLVPESAIPVGWRVYGTDVRTVNSVAAKQLAGFERGKYGTR